MEHIGLGIYLLQARNYSLRDVPYLLPDLPINTVNFERRNAVNIKLFT